jgi:hypothetical protein
MSRRQQPPRACKRRATAPTSVVDCAALDDAPNVKRAAAAISDESPAIAIGSTVVPNPVCPVTPLPEYMRARMITVKMLTGEMIRLVVTPTESVVSVRGRLSQRTGIPHRMLRLIFGGVLLLDGTTMAEANIQQDSTVYGLMNFRGD